MQLTKGQKDALRRKALEIIYKKQDEKREELKKSWKPSKEIQKFLNGLRELIEMRDKYLAAYKKLGFEEGWCCYDYTSKEFTLHLSSNDKKSYDDIFNDIVRQIVSKQMDNLKFPDDCSVQDKIELATLSKDFKMEDFLAEYENL